MRQLVGSLLRRAEAIQQRIVVLAKRRDIPLDAIHADDRGVWTEILAGPERIMGITESDAKAAERRRPELAAEYTEVIRLVVKQYRAEHTWGHALWGAFYAVLATGGFAGLVVFLFLIRHRARSRVEKWLGQLETEISGQSFRTRVVRSLGRPLLALSRATFWILVLALVQAYVTVVLRFFPSTKYTSYQITNWLVSELAECVSKFAGVAFPNREDGGHFYFGQFAYLIKLNEYILEKPRTETCYSGLLSRVG
jgi:hypothetical protein